MRNRTTERKAFRRYITEGEEVRLFRHLAKHTSRYAQRDMWWMRLLRQTGMRLGSLCSLTVGQAILALESGTLSLADEQAKGGNGYDIILNTAARRALQELLRIRRSLRRTSHDDEALIVSQRGAALSERSYQHRMRCWCLSAGLGVEASPHWWRHTFAKRIVARSNAKDPLAVAQIALGHRDRRATVIYTLPDREEVLAALESAS